VRFVVEAFDHGLMRGGGAELIGPLDRIPSGKLDAAAQGGSSYRIVPAAHIERLWPVQPQQRAAA